MMSNLRTLLSLICLTVFAACSGGSGPVERVPTAQGEDDVSDPIAPSQQATDVFTSDPDPLDDFGTEPPIEVELEASTLLETLDLEGDVDTVLQGLVVVGEGDTRAIVRRDGVYRFVDETLTLADLPATLSRDIPGAFLVSSGILQVDGTGIIGIATADVDVPISGNATYSGGAAGFVVTPAAGFDLTNGQSLVTVAFGTGFVTAELSNFTDISQVSGNTVNAPIAEIILRDAQISGSGFSGGALETRDGFGDLVNLTGANTTLQAEGQFFGIDADSQLPKEVGGLIYSVGDNGIVFGSFIAD